MSEHTKYNVLFVYLTCIHLKQMYNHVAAKEQRRCDPGCFPRAIYLKEMEA